MAISRTESGNFSYCGWQFLVLWVAISRTRVVLFTKLKIRCLCGFPDPKWQFLVPGLRGRKSQNAENRQKSFKVAISRTRVVLVTKIRAVFLPHIMLRCLFLWQNMVIRFLKPSARISHGSEQAAGLCKTNDCER